MSKEPGAGEGYKTDEERTMALCCSYDPLLFPSLGVLRYYSKRK